MNAPFPQPAAGQRADSGPAAESADWLRLARIARTLSWLTLVWMGIEGGVAIGAAVVAGSVARRWQPVTGPRPASSASSSPPEPPSSSPPSG